MTGAVVWFTGLPSSGKTTLAARLALRLRELRVPHCTLDGDVMRPILAPKLGYSDGERDEFYLALAELAAELSRQGLVVLVAATGHRRVYRKQARDLAPYFCEVWVDTPLDECERRDSKGLYSGSIGTPGHMPGIDVLYEAPEAPDVTSHGGDDEPALQQIIDRLESPAAARLG